jgi:hypothetical protein
VSAFGSLVNFIVRRTWRVVRKESAIVNVLRALVLTLVGSAAAAVALGAELQATGVVTPLVAEFLIPVAHEGPWRWARAHTPDNALEFRWELSVMSRDAEYQFGFSMFKFPGSKEGAGNLDELLKAGQASLWRIASDGGGSLVQGAKVSATAGNGGIVVRVSDPASLRLLFGDRPAVATAFAKTPDSSRESQEVSIEYRE